MTTTPTMAPPELVAAAAMLAPDDRVTPLEVAASAAEAIAEALVSNDAEVIKRASILAGEAHRLANPYHLGVGVRWLEQTRQLLSTHAVAVGGHAWAADIAPPLDYGPFTGARGSRLGR